MKRILTSVFFGASLAAASLAPAAAQYVPPGSYQQSCTNIRVSGDQLIARCTNNQGARVRSSLTVGSCRGGDIANSNGQLVCNGGGYGNRNRGRDRDRDGNRGNGGYYGNGNGGYNGNGNGGYNGNGNGGYAPAGSYQQSCRNVSARGGMLTATCPSANGTMITSSIDSRSCRGADIANRNGRLVCQ